MQNNEKAVLGGTGSEGKKRINRGVLMLLILHCAVILFCIGFFMFEKQGRFYGEYQDSDSRYFSVYGVRDEEGRGYLVDESIGGDGLFTCGPYMELKKGIYNITIYYEADGQGNQCMAYAEDEVENYADALLTDAVILDPEHTIKTFTIRNKRDCQDFEVQTYYGGHGSLLVKKIVISQGAADSLYTILKILCVTALADIVLFLFYARKKKLYSKESILIGFALAGIIGFASSPLFRGALFHYSTDMNFILMRIEGLKDGLLSGMFPVRIQPNWLNGYGYATSIFYGDLFLILPATLRIFGVSVQGAYFAYVFCMNLSTCLIAYFCLKAMFKVRHIALIGSCLYTLSTFRLELMYVLSRGGMYTAYTFLPLIAYGVYLIYYDSKNRKSWFYLSLGMTGILQSHLLTTEITVFALALIVLVSAKRFFKKDSVLAMLKAVGASILLNIGFLVPMLDYMRDVQVSSDSWKTIYNYIQRSGEDGSGFLLLFREGRSAWSPDLILLLGQCLFLVILICIPFEKMKGERERKYREMGIVTFTVSLILLVMGTKYFPWDTIEDMFPASRMVINSLQFPHRFYEITTILLTITLCCGLMILKGRMEKGDYRVGLTVVLGICLLSGGYLISDVVNHASTVTIYDTEGLDDNRTSTNEYLPAGANQELFIHETAVAEVGITVNSFRKDRLHIRLQCVNEKEENGYVELPLVYYEGYQAKDSAGNRLNVSCGENKTVLLEIPPDYFGEISVFFREPVIWTITFWISVMAMAGMTGRFIFAKGKKTEK